MKKKADPRPLSARIETFHLEVDSTSEIPKGTYLSRLMEWIPLAHALENGELLAEARGETAALEAEKVALSTQNQALEAENQTVKAESKDFESLLYKANEEVSRIQAERKKQQEQSASQEEKIERLEKDNAGLRKILKDRLPGHNFREFVPPPFKNPSDRVLHVLAQQNHPIYIGDIASQAEVSPAGVRHDLQDFAARELAEEVFDPEFGRFEGWRLTQKGDAHVVQQGLAEPPKSAMEVLNKPPGLAEKYPGLA